MYVKCLAKGRLVNLKNKHAFEANSRYLKSINRGWCGYRYPRSGYRYLHKSASSLKRNERNISKQISKKIRKQSSGSGDIVDGSETRAISFTLFYHKLWRRRYQRPICSENLPSKFVSTIVHVCENQNGINKWRKFASVQIGTERTVLKRKRYQKFGSGKTAYGSETRDPTHTDQTKNLLSR